MTPTTRTRWVPRALRRATAAPARRDALRFEPLEAREVPAVIAMNFNPAYTATEGVPAPNAVGTALATFDVDNYIGLNQSGQLSAEILWGDGDVSAGLGPTTVTFNADLGGGRARYNVFAGHTYAAATTNSPFNPYTVTFRVYDGTNQGTITAASNTLTVADQPLVAAAAQPTLAATAGSSLTSVVVARFIDRNPLSRPGHLSALITWNNPSVQTAGVIVAEPGMAPGGGVQYSVVGTHAFTSANPASSIQVLVQSQVNVTMVNNTVAVSQGAILPTAIPVTITEGATTIPAGTTLGTFTDLGGGQPAVNYTGSSFALFPGAVGTTTLNVVRNGTTNTYTVSTAAPTTLAAPARIGSFNYRLRIQDTSGNAGETFGALFVLNAPITNVLGGAVANQTEGVPATFTGLLTFTDANPGAAPGEYTVTVDWGDGTPQTTGTVVSLGGGNYRVDGTHTYTRRTGGPLYRITVAVTDAGGQTVTNVTNTFVVQDAALSGGTSIPIVAAAGQSLNGVPVAFFTDANPFALATDVTATIEWGDGTPNTTGNITVVGRSGTGTLFQITGNHTYNTATGSPFTTRVTVTDVGGATLGPIFGTATIAPSAIPVTVFPQAGPAGAPLPLVAPLATFPNVTGNPSPAAYSATVNWGDGSAPVVVGAGVGIAYVAATNSFTFTPPVGRTYASPGLYPITVTVAGPGAWTGTGSSTAVVSAPALVASAAPNITTAVEGAPLPATTTVATFTVANPAALAAGYTATIDWGDGSPRSTGTIAATGPGAFAVRGGHTYTRYAAGPLTVNVTIEDAFGNTVTALSTVTTVADAALTNGTGTPVVGAAGQQLVNVPLGTFVDANPFATAADHTATVTWGDATPPSAGFVQLVGRVGGGALFAVYGSHTYINSSGAAPYAVNVTVADAGGANAAFATTATITQTPFSVSVLPQNGAAGTPLVTTAPLAVFTDENGSGVVTDYTATINWGDGSAPQTFAAGQGITFNAAANRFSFTSPVAHTYARPGVYPLTVSVTGPNTRLGVGTNSAVVVPAALAAAPAAPIATAVEGAPLPAATVVATFTVADPAAVATGFTASIDWGAGTPATTGTIVGTGPGAFQVRGGHTYTRYAAAGHTVTVTVRDAYGNAVEARTQVTVVADALLSTGAGIPVVGEAGEQLTNVTVGTFVDANPFGTAGDHAVTISWGDGTPATVGLATLVGRSGTGLLFAVSGTHTYANSTASPYTITVNVTDAGGSAVGFTTLATVTQSPVVVSVLSQNGAAGTPLVIVPPLAVFTDVNGSGVAAQYTATVNYGDGSPAVTYAAGAGITFVPAGNRFTFTPPTTHTYARPGVYPITVTVTGPDNRLGIGAATAVIVPPAFVGGVVAGANITVNEGTPIPPNTVLATFTIADPAATANGFVVDIDWGDQSPYSMGVVTRTGGTATTSTFSVTGGHTYTDFGVYTVRVRVADAFGGGGTATLTATITDAPLVNPVGISATGTVRQPLVNATLGVFTDTNLFGDVNDYTAVINWNDPLAPAADTVGLITPVGGTAAGATFAVAGSHVYGRAGTYAVSVVVTDRGGQTTTINTTVTIIAPALTGQANPIVATEGQPTPAGLVVASFNSPGATNAAIYTVTVNWGDGGTNTTATGVTVTSVGGGNFIVQAPPHTYQNDQPYVLTVTVTGTDGSGPLALSAPVTVQDAPLTGINGAVTLNEGTPYNPPPVAPLVTFTDANPFSTSAEFAATIDWGDDATSFGTISQPGGPGTAYSVTGRHTYRDNGMYTAIVLITDVGGQRTTARAAVTVNNVAPTGRLTNTGPVDENSPVSVSLVDVFDPSSEDTAAGFRYSFADTMAGLATTYLGAGTLSSATFTFPDGPLSPTVFGRVFDKDGGFSDYQTTVTVRNVAPTATFTASGPNLPGQPVALTFSNQRDVSPVDTAAGFTYEYDLGTGTFGPRTTSPTATFAPPRAGTFTVRGRIYDKDGGVSEYSLGGGPGGLVIKDPTIFAVGAGSGGAPIVRVYSPVGNLVASFFAYDPNYRGGVNVAVGDVTGDGIPDVVTGTGPGGGPHVKVFDGRDFSNVGNMFATHSGFRGGVHVAVGDVDGDGKADIITGAGNTGAPQVQVFRGSDYAQIRNFFAYDQGFRGGVNVAAGDVNGDGRADIVAGAGIGGAPHVKVFDGASGAERLSFFAYESTQTGGVNVAVGDVDGDGRAEIVTGPGIGGGARLRSFDAQTGTPEQSVFAYGPDRVNGQPLRNGMTVAVVGQASIRGAVVVVGSGPGYSSMISVRDGKTFDELGTLIPFDEGGAIFDGGIFIG